MESKNASCFAAQKIRELREKNRIVQSSIAAMLNCSQVCYSNYELGKREIPIDILIVLANFYNVSIDYLLGLTDCKKRYPKAKKRSI